MNHLKISTRLALGFAAMALVIIVLGVHCATCSS